jgi:hypothetical protein
MEVNQKRLSDGAIHAPIVQVQNQQQIQSQISPVQLPPNMAQIQQQFLSQRGSLGENEFMTLDMMAKKFIQPVTQPSTISTPILQPPLISRSRAGSHSGAQTPIQQRKSGAPTMSSSPAPQQFTRNVNTTAQSTSSHIQSPITTQTVISPTNDQLNSFIAPLSQALSMMNVNNPLVMQQLLSSPQFLAQIPQFASNPAALEILLRQIQQLQSMQVNNQQGAEFEKIFKLVIQMVGPNAPPQVSKFSQFKISFKYTF